MNPRTHLPAPLALRARELTSAAGVSWSLRACPPGGLRDPAAPEAVLSELPATVPGEVHTDLQAAGVIPDPFDGDNEGTLAWIGRTDWTYTARFRWTGDGHARHDLVADGLDTVATVTLNGRLVGRTRNQHRGYRFEVTDLLVDGENEVVVAFEAPVTAAERLEAELGGRPHVNHHPYNAIRKMAANYGWDWGPDVATAGIWKPIRIESWTGVRLAAVRPLATVEGGSGVLSTHLGLEWAGAERPEAAVTVEVAGGSDTVTVPAGANATVVVRVPDARLWWPRGYGEPELYDVRVRLAVDGVAVDGWSGRIGFRTVEVDAAPDLYGTAFALSVNGVPVYVRGANWIPGDAFVTRMTPQRYASGIRDALGANLNLLRVWGGGLYESEDFYRLCDEHGMLVWQDFLFACAAYSEEEPLRGEVEEEARQAVTRLSRHASLALWSGGNENFEGYVEWFWRVPLAGRSWGRGYYLDLLPALVAELDPRTPYVPGSPYSFSEFVHPNDPRHGSQHLWEVWNRRDYAAYREQNPRFVAEFGFQGPPGFSTLTGVVHDEPLTPGGRTMLVHQKADDGNGKLERGLGDHLPRWRDFDEWHWATQLNQARAVGFGIEHFRSLSPLNRGAVVWQLNDCWPVVSWSAVDSAGVRKPVWHTLRRVFAERLLTVQPRDGELLLFAHNDTRARWRTQVRVERASSAEGGAVLAEQLLAIDVAAGDTAAVPLDAGVAVPGDPTAEFLVARCPTAGRGEAVPAFWYFVEDTALCLRPRPAVTRVEVARGEGGLALTVAATALLKDLTLLVDRLDPTARVDSGMVTLTAGESHTFRVDSDRLDPAGLTAITVLRSANDLVV